MEMEIHTVLKEALGWASGYSEEQNIKIESKTGFHKTSTLVLVSEPVNAWRMLCWLNRPLLAPCFLGEAA